MGVMEIVINFGGELGSLPGSKGDFELGNSLLNVDTIRLRLI